MPIMVQAPESFAEMTNTGIN